MTRHYSTRDVFRQMPNALLARYFASRDVLPDFDFAAMKETKIDALFDAWMTLPEAVRVKLEAELREIWDMSCVAGTAGHRGRWVKARSACELSRHSATY